MKYFGDDWMDENVSDEDKRVRVAEYQQHIGQIITSLPVELRPIALPTPELNLHDGLFKELIVDAENDAIALRLRCGDLQAGYYDLNLKYLKARMFPEPDETLVRHLLSPTTEIITDEVDIVAANIFEHRLRVWPEELWDLVIQFSDFRLDRRDVRSRYSP